LDQAPIRTARRQASCAEAAARKETVRAICGFCHGPTPPAPAARLVRSTILAHVNGNLIGEVIKNGPGQSMPPLPLPKIKSQTSPHTSTRAPRSAQSSGVPAAYPSKNSHRSSKRQASSKCRRLQNCTRPTAILLASPKIFLHRIEAHMLYPDFQPCRHHHFANGEKSPACSHIDDLWYPSGRRQIRWNRAFARDAVKVELNDPATLIANCCQTYARRHAQSYAYISTLK